MIREAVLACALDLKAVGNGQEQEGQEHWQALELDASLRRNTCAASQIKIRFARAVLCTTKPSISAPVPLGGRQCYALALGAARPLPQTWLLWSPIVVSPDPLAAMAGPNELPLYLEGDEALGALAAEGADLVGGLTRELSATRESHMAAWGIDGDEKQEGGADGSGVGETGVGPEGVEVEDEDERRAARDHGRCMLWWEKVVGRWHERTQLVDPSLQRKFKVVNQGPWVQVMASLADEERAKRKAFMPVAEVRASQGVSRVM